MLARAALPFGYVLAAFKSVLLLALYLLYVALVRGVCLVFVSWPSSTQQPLVLTYGCQIPVPPLYRLVAGLLTSAISRLVLLLVGLWWIPVELVARKRGQANKNHSVPFFRSS